MNTITLRPENRRRRQNRGNYAPDLAAREARACEIAQLNSDGLSDKEIALRLGVSRGTIAYYLEMPSRAVAARRSA